MTSSKKITLIGTFGVGKSSLFRRFIENQFSEDYQSTLGVQIKKKTVTLDSGESMSLIIWDTEGKEDVSMNRSSYLLGSHCIIYVFDLSRVDTFTSINEHLAFLKENYPNILLKVVGNKSDAVSIKSVQKKLSALDITPDFFTSALSGEQVNDLFTLITKELL